MLNNKELDELFFIQHQITDDLLSDSGLRTFTSRLNEHLEADVYIFDRFRDDLIYMDKKFKNDPEFRDYLNERKLTRKDSVFKCCQREAVEYHFEWDGQEFIELQFELGKDEIVGVLALSNYKKLGTYEFRILILAAHSLALKIHQNKLISELAQKCSSELIEDLLNNRIENRAEVIQRGRLANWDLGLNYQLYLFSIESKNKKSELNTYYHYEIRERIMQKIYSLLSREIKREFILFSHDKDVILMINYQKREDVNNSDIELIRKELSNKLDKYYFNIGSGSYIKDVSEISESYQQASYVLDFLDATDRKNIVYHYSQLGIMRLLWQIDQQDLKEFTTEYLAKLIEYDKGNNTEWLDTLGVYLEEGGSIQQAAKRLFIHPNTMSYRVKRIKEILGIDLQDQEIQLNLLAAYKICKYILDDNLDI